MCQYIIKYYCIINIHFENYRRVFTVLYKKKVFQLVKVISIFSYVELFPGKYLEFSISTCTFSIHRLDLDTAAQAHIKLKSTRPKTRIKIRNISLLVGNCALIGISVDCVTFMVVVQFSVLAVSKLKIGKKEETFPFISEEKINNDYFKNKPTHIFQGFILTFPYKYIYMYASYK